MFGTENFPKEVLLYICGFLEPSDLSFLGQVNKLFYRIAADDSLWRRFFITDLFRTNNVKQFYPLYAKKLTSINEVVQYLSDNEDLKKKLLLEHMSTIKEVLEFSCTLQISNQEKSTTDTQRDDEFGTKLKQYFMQCNYQNLQTFFDTLNKQDNLQLKYLAAFDMVNTFSENQNFGDWNYFPGDSYPSF